MEPFGTLQKLDFGTIIYDLADGQRGIIGIKDTNSVQVLWEIAGLQTYNEHSFGFVFSFEKPKKKVKKELIMFAEIRDNGIRAITDYRSEQCDTPITITYETEE